LILGGKQLSDMYSELISLKSEYKMLKNNYNKLLIDKK
jgi:archaellum component FlaC